MTASPQSTTVYHETAGLVAAPRAVAIGNFDGVHMGHREVIQTAVEAASAQGIRSCILTFDRHPLSVLDPVRQPRLLTAPAEKTELLAGLGADELVVLSFTEAVAALTPAQFCRVVLVEGLRARLVVVGANFTFGAGGRGDVHTLRHLGEDLDVAVIAVPLVTADGRPISSTRIRRLLASGDLAEVRAILGRPPSTHGVVVGGWQRGRILGVPTANLDVEAGTIFPGRGVYAGRASVRGQWYRSAINVGHNPTFQSPAAEVAVVRIEAHLLDFSGDLYGQPIRVDFLQKIRDEVRFDRVEDLIAQMRRDIAMCRGLDDHAFREVGLV